LARTAVLVAVSAALLVFAWLELEAPAASFVEVGAMLGLALVPAALAVLTRRLWPALVALVVCAAPAAGVAFDVPVTEMRPGPHDYFGPVFASIADGTRDLWETDAPFDIVRHPELAGLVLLAIYGFVALIALLLVRDRPLSAGIALVVGVGVPITVAASYGVGSPLRIGGLVLAALLVLLYLTARKRQPLRGAGTAAVLGLVVVLAAVGASVSSAVSKDAFVSWSKWDLYDRPTDPVGVRYVWSSNYSGIKFPKKATVVLTVKAPDKAYYWRATTLDEYTGVGWREDLLLAPARQVTEVTDALQDPDLPRVAKQARNWTRQEVTVVGLSDNHLIAAAAPIKWEPSGEAPVQYAQNGVVVASGGLRLGETYSVWSYTPEVKPRELSKLGPDYPTDILRYLEVVPDVSVPPFGAPGRSATVGRLFAERSDDALLGEYQPLYREAEKVVGKAKSPYLAAVTLETWFRSEGGFTYSEQPPQPVGPVPPLVDFVLRTKSGYCQHYAGAMAIMLRLLGIPARVAVGFTTGSYDKSRKEWKVTDHDAHAWVEVFFPGYGWLPFDPTPGRGSLGGAYSTSSLAFPTGVPTALGVPNEALSAILRERLAGSKGGGTANDLAPVGAATGLDEEGGGGIGVTGFVLISLAGLLALLLVGKAVRRQARFLSKDPRKVATACRRDLVAYLSDQRIGFPESATLEQLGAYLERHYRVNATPFVNAVNGARFGSPERAAASAVRARRELRELESQLRSQLSATSRARGAVSLRSLTV